MKKILWILLGLAIFAFGCLNGGTGLAMIISLLGVFVMQIGIVPILEKMLYKGKMND